MKKMRILSAVCAAAVLTTMVASCGNGGKDNGSNDDKKGGTPELVYWTVGGGTGSNEEAFKAVNKYLEEKENIKLKVNIADWGDYDTKINTILNSGEYFDLLFTNNSNYLTAVELNAFADITDLVEKETPELKKVVPENLWEGAKVDGKVYAVPTYKDSSITQYWYIDKKYVDKYNIDMKKVTTFEELDKVFRKVKEGEGKNFYPFKTSQGSLFNGLWNGYDGLCVGLPPLGAIIDKDSPKVVNLLEEADMQKKFEFLNSWYKDGITNPDAPTSTENYKQCMFGTAQGFPGAEAVWAANAGIEEYVPVQVFGPLYTTETIRGSMNAVGSKSKYKSEALKYLQLANTDGKFRDMLAYGAPDKDFKYVEDDVVEKLSDNYSWPSYTQGTFFELSTVKGAPKDQWDQVKKLNEQAKKSPLLGFALDIKPVKTEVTACKTVYDQYKYELETGAKDLKKVLPELNKKLKDAGFDKIIKEAQKQVDEFMENQK